MCHVQHSPALWEGWSSYITFGAAVVCWKMSMQASLLHKPVRIILSHCEAFTKKCPCYCTVTTALFSGSFFLQRMKMQSKEHTLQNEQSVTVWASDKTQSIKTHSGTSLREPPKPSRTSQPHAQSGVPFDYGGCHDDGASSPLILHRKSEWQWHPMTESGTRGLWVITWMPGELYWTLKSLRESV